MLFIQWFRSATFRSAVELRRHVERLVNEQRDLLSDEAVGGIHKAVEELKNAWTDRLEKDVLQTRMGDLVAVAEKSLLPYSHAALRENIKEFFVAATVILAITTFFFQLTKIPTGSMQPTLFGITHYDLKKKPGAEIPNRLRRFWDYWVRGISYYHVVAKGDGDLSVAVPRRIFPLIKSQSLRVGNDSYRVWFPPEKLKEWAGLHEGQLFQRGDDILRLKVVAGDYLLVDRITYNFRRPERGEIIVFKTRGIPDLLDQDQLYIKRLVALGGERVSIGDDQHLVINEDRLDASTPHFENVYTFTSVPRSGEYFGHVNQTVANRTVGLDLARHFLTATNEYKVRTKHYLAMGDNTLNSHDSRSWGDLPQENVIGKCWFVYWPFTKRFGWANR